MAWSVKKKTVFVLLQCLPGCTEPEHHIHLDPLIFGWDLLRLKYFAAKDHTAILVDMDVSETDCTLKLEGEGATGTEKQKKISREILKLRQNTQGQRATLQEHQPDGKKGIKGRS